MLSFLIIFIVICVIINYFLRAEGYTGIVTDHFDGKHFKNIINGGNLVHRLHERAGDELPAFTFFFKKFCSNWKERALPHGQAVPAERVFGSEIVVTFVNHSTVLIQTEGVNILTDPVWSRRASPFQFFGPKRYMESGVALEKLPKIDLILLTHNHYDHMDISVLRKITERDRCSIYTALGNCRLLRQKGIKGAVDMDWGDARKFSDTISVGCVPAQHFSARALSDRNKTLWAGFVIRSAHGDIYFAGDTGYGHWVEHVKKMYPKGFRLAFLPIGAFKPHSFMGEVHMGPDDAIDVYKELNIGRAVPIHFGTFDLALDKQDEPVERLESLLKKEQNFGIHFDVLQNGEVLSIK